MLSMELQRIERLNYFKRVVVMPVFRQVQQDLEPLGYRVQIAQTLVTGDGPLDELLGGLVRKFSATFLADADAEFGECSRQILAALMVQLPPGVLETKHLYEDRLCLGVESRVDKDGAFPTIVSVFGADREGQFKLFHHGFGRQGEGCDIARLSAAVLLQQVLNILAAFHVQGLSSRH
jgi:hypothetical protein